jgi:CRISPR-associated RAMP protein, csm5 family
MESYLKKYKFVFRTVGPVFVGSGQELQKKEYIFDGKKVKIIDVDKMLGFFCKDERLMKGYEKLVLTDRSDNLQKFFKEYGVGEDVYKAWILKEYNVRGSSFNGEKINTFVRDAQGKVYIPGSSLKGMLRTIILLYHICHADEGYRKAVGKRISDIMLDKGLNKDKLNQSLDEVDMDMNIEFLHRKDLTGGEEDIKNAVNSIMRGLRVCDSKLELDRKMGLYKKYDVSTNGKGHNIPLVRECINPSVEIEMEIAIDSTIFPYTENELLKMIEEFGKYYWEKFEKKFQKEKTVGYPSRLNRQIRNYTGGPRIFLGGGVGFVSKTDIYALFDEEKAVQITGKILDIMDRDSKDREEGEKKDKKHREDYKISPRVLKCVEIGNGRFEMGECKVISIKEI